MLVQGKQSFLHDMIYFFLASVVVSLKILDSTSTIEKPSSPI